MKSMEVYGKSVEVYGSLWKSVEVYGNIIKKYLQRGKWGEKVNLVEVYEVS